MAKCGYHLLDDDDIEEILSDEVNQEIVEELKKTALESQKIQQEALVEKIKEAALEPIGYVKKSTNTFESTSVETTTGGGSTTTFADGRVVRTAADGTETVISGPTA